MANKRIGDVEGDVIVTGGILAGLYFFIAKPLINTLGDSPEDKATVQSLDTLAPAANFFSLQFQGYLNYLQQKYGTTNPAQDFALWQSLASQDLSGYVVGSGNTIADVAVGAEAINNSFGFWKWSQDINTVISVFNTVPDQLTVTLMDAYLQANYQVDLLTLIKNGSTARIPILQTRNGLNDTQLAAIIRRISSLPVDIES